MQANCEVDGKSRNVGKLLKCQRDIVNNTSRVFTALIEIFP